MAGRLRCRWRHSGGCFTDQKLDFLLFEYLADKLLVFFNRPIVISRGDELMRDDGRPDRSRYGDRSCEFWIWAEQLRERFCASSTPTGEDFVYFVHFAYCACFAERLE